VLSVLENFGNLNLTVSIEEFEKTGIRFGETVHVTLERDGTAAFDSMIPYDRSFGYAALGAPILFNGSTGYIGLGLNQESFAGRYMKDRYDHPEGIAAYDVTIRK
jgi:S-adenosylmethionine hydrolase